jgi:PIN domain nuclease of toxin-antitoxin system
MSFILDTHVFFWWITDDPRIEARHRQAIEAGNAPIYVSAVSGWEIAIKVNIGKWPEAAVLLPGLREKVLAEGFETLDLTLAQAETAGLLALVHKDPFDRLIAAQSLMLNVPVATVDPAMALFGCGIV